MSSFFLLIATMISKVVCCRDLRKYLYVGKGKYGHLVLPITFWVFNNYRTIVLGGKHSWTMRNCLSYCNAFNSPQLQRHEKLPVVVEPFPTMSNYSFYRWAPVAQSIISNAGCQSRGCEFESQLGQHSFQRLTKVIVTGVIRLPPIGYQSMSKSSQLLGKNVVWSTGVRKPRNIWVGELGPPWYDWIFFENGIKPQSINQYSFYQKLFS